MCRKGVATYIREGRFVGQIRERCGHRWQVCRTRTCSRSILTGVVIFEVFFINLMTIIFLMHCVL